MSDPACSSCRQSALPEAMILAGGLGSRLQSVVSDVPKVLAPINDIPVILHLLSWLERQGVSRVILCLGYKAQMVVAAVGDRYGAMEIVHSVEHAPLGTGGALRLAAGQLRGDRAVILNGDTFLGLSLRDMHAFYEESENRGVMTLIHMRDTEGRETVDIDSDDRFRRFIPREEGESPAWINAGCYILPKEKLLSIPGEQAVSLERDIFPQWARHKMLCGYKTAAPFLDMGTPSHYETASAFVDSWKRTTPQWVAINRDGILLERQPLHNAENIVLSTHVPLGLKSLQDAGLKLGVFGCQSEVEHRHCDKGEIQRLHAAIDRMLRRDSVEVDGWYLCHHAAEDTCLCRPPRTGLLRAFALEHKLDLSRGCLIGSCACDVDMGVRCGVPSIIVSTDNGRLQTRRIWSKSVLCAADFAQACQQALGGIA